MAYNWDSDIITLQDKINELNEKFQSGITIDFSNKRIFTTIEPIEGATSPGKQGSVAFIIQG